MNCNCNFKAAAFTATMERKISQFEQQALKRLEMCGFWIFCGGKHSLEDPGTPWVSAFVFVLNWDNTGLAPAIKSTVADLGFPRRGHRPMRGRQPIIFQFFPKTA